MDNQRANLKLTLTERGELWLNNFEDHDKPLARELANSLTLISEIEFERELIQNIENCARNCQGLIALFNVRELADGETVFPNDTAVLDGTPRGHDIGSEGRIASIIRNFARQASGRFLVSPTLSEIKEKRCSNMFFIDDFIGSGKRVTDFLNSFYGHPTIKSWFSLKRFKTKVICYSGTNDGITRVKGAQTSPIVSIVRSCSTIQSKVWNIETKKKLERICLKYARRNKMGYALGFGKVGALMVFEHSCPNNVPVIFWGSNNRCPWVPLFEGKSVSLDVRRIFPAEISRSDPVSTLIEAGETRIAKAARSVVNQPLPAEWLATLSLFKSGVRRVDALEGISGMNHFQATKVVESCVNAGLLTQRWRLTNFGRQELMAAQKAMTDAEKKLPKKVEDDYYPHQLRCYKKS